MRRDYLIVAVLLIIGASAIAFLSFTSTSNPYSVAVDREGRTSNKGLELNLPSFSVTGDCTDLVKHNTNENYYPDEDYSGSAHAYAEIDLSRMYGKDCSQNPYKDFAKVRVSCEGYSRESDGPLYVYRLDQNADWDDAKDEITCTEYGCAGDDQEFSSGTHTVNLRDEAGEIDSVFFICYDYDSSSYWTWTWTGWGFYGSRKVCESRKTKKCSNDDVYWYDSCNNKEDKVDECGSDSCQDWGSSYCDANKVKKDRTCYERGCSSGSCFQNTNQETKTVETCDDVKYGDNYCKSNSVYRTKKSETCNYGSCVFTESEELVKSCDFDCYQGDCIEKGDVSGNTLLEFLDMIVDTIKDALG